MQLQNKPTYIACVENLRFLKSDHDEVNRQVFLIRLTTFKVILRKIELWRVSLRMFSNGFIKSI